MRESSGIPQSNTPHVSDLQICTIALEKEAKLCPVRTSVLGFLWAKVKVTKCEPESLLADWRVAPLKKRRQPSSVHDSAMN